MGQTIGIVSRFPEHVADFELAYYEVKDVTGVWHDPIPGAIPMVSVFGDNRQAALHPEWVQMGPDGQPATRAVRYFDWDALCPSHPEVWDLAMAWIRDAVRLSGTGRLRLDDAGFAREGYCQCAECQRQSARRGLTIDAYRRERIAEFVESLKPLVGAIDMTLFPDPMPGHLESRFGVDLDRLAATVDRFVIPLYDMHYATTYWLEVLAQGFRDRLKRPFFVELYALMVPEAALGKAAEVAQAYADGVLFAYGNHREPLLRIRERLGGA